MYIYIGLAHVAFALALCGGFYFGRFLFTRKVKEEVESNAFRHYQAQYNEQMAELCARYRQERLALIHRFEGLTAELEQEIQWLKAGCDPDATKKTRVFPDSTIDNIEATDLVPYMDEIEQTERLA